MNPQHDAPEGGAVLYLVTDFDRIEGGMFGEQADASDKAAQLARQFPGNTVHVLATCETHRAERAAAPTPPAPVGLVDAVRAYLTAANSLKAWKWIEGHPSEWTTLRHAQTQLNKTRRALDVALSEQSQ